MAEYNPRILIASSIATPTYPQVPFQTTNWAGSDATVPASSRMGWAGFIVNGVDSDADPNAYAFELISDNWS